jgi:galactokinase
VPSNNLDHALLTAGFDPEEARSRAGLIRRVIRAFAAVVLRRPAWGWFVPGRVEVIGKHTDYAGGRSLIAAVPRGFAVVAYPRADQRVRVIDAATARIVEVTVDGQVSTRSDWAEYVAAVVRRLAHDFPGAPLGADVAILSDLPPAAGLSSSSALVIGVATALVERAGLRDWPAWRTAIDTPIDFAGYLGALESGLGFKTFGATLGVGTHGGSEDHTAILTGHAGHVAAYQYVPVQFLATASVPAGWRFVIATSGVSARKTGGAREPYNRASRATRTLLGLWNAYAEQSAPTLAAALASHVGAAAALAARAAVGDHDGFRADDLVARLAHFVAEDARVLPAVDAFSHEDASALAALAAASQEDADRLLGNQVDETRRLAGLAREVGAFAATSFGAGYGGSVWALVPADDATAFASTWTRAYLEAVRVSAPVEAFTTRGAPGLLQVPIDV